MKRFIAIIVTAVLFFTIVAACSESERPLSVEELLSLGEQFLLDGDYEQALVQFMLAIEVEPMNPRGHTGAAEAYVGLGDYARAREVLEDGLSVLGDNDGIRRMLYDIDRVEEERWQAEIEAEVEQRLAEMEAEEDEITNGLRMDTVTVFAVYYEILRGYIERFGGIVEPGQEWGQLLDGIHFAGLFDFDNDGLPELLINGPIHYHEYYSPLDITGFGHIYGYLPQAGIVLLYVTEMRAGGLAANTFPFWIEIAENGKAYLVRTSSMGWLGRSEWFSTLENGSFVNALTRHPYAEDWSNTDSRVFYVNDVRVSQEVYENAPASELGIIVRLLDWWSDMWNNPDSVNATLEYLSATFTQSP